MPPTGLAIRKTVRSMESSPDIWQPYSGEIAVRLKAVPKALSYELRYAAVAADNGGALVWTIQTVTGVKAPVTVTGLKPGTT